MKASSVIAVAMLAAALWALADARINFNYERNSMITDVDRMLYRGVNMAEEDGYDLTLNDVDVDTVRNILQSSLGDGYEDLVEVPTQPISMLELLRLSSSVNEMVMEENERTRGVRGGPCVCHGTASVLGGGLFKGVRMLGVHGWGHIKEHNNKPYSARDCTLITGHNSPLCCNGLCATDGTTSSTPPLDLSQANCPAAAENDVSGCTVVAPTNCQEAVNLCSSCTEAITAFQAGGMETPCDCADAVDRDTPSICPTCDDKYTALDDNFDCTCLDFANQYSGTIG